MQKSEDLENFKEDSDEKSNLNLKEKEEIKKQKGFITLPSNSCIQKDLELESKLEELRALQEDTKEDPFEINSYIDSRVPIVSFFDATKDNEKDLDLEKKDAKIKAFTKSPKEVLNNKLSEKIRSSDANSLEEILKISDSLFTSSTRNNLLDTFFDLLDESSFDPKSSKNSFFNDILSSNRNIIRPNLDYSSSEISIVFELSSLMKHHKINPQTRPKFFGTLRKIPNNKLNLELTIDFDGKEITENIIIQDIRRYKNLLSNEDYYMSYKYDSKQKTIYLKITLNKNNQSLQ